MSHFVYKLVDRVFITCTKIPPSIIASRFSFAYITFRNVYKIQPSCIAITSLKFIYPYPHVVVSWITNTKLLVYFRRVWVYSTHDIFIEKRAITIRGDPVNDSLIPMKKRKTQWKWENKELHFTHLFSTWNSSYDQIIRLCIVHSLDSRLREENKLTRSYLIIENVDSLVVFSQLDR